jgi:D-alanyl-D-alanine carboxypeptidase/D-alanyl-D-alanine-endopeptidase (penicillin-binding protein 4)
MTARARLVPILLLLGANCALILWKVAFAPGAPGAPGASSTTCTSEALAGDAGPPLAGGARGATAAITLPAFSPVALAAPSAAPVADVLAATRRAPELEARIRRRIAEAAQLADELSKGKVKPSEVQVSVHVRELRGASDLVSIEGDRAMRPASNMKLVTSAGALVLLGPEWCFETVFESPGPIESGILRGDLVVHAGGDPLYDREAQGDVSRFFAPVVAALKAKSIARIEGAIVLDEGSFQEPGPAPSWPAEGERWKEFCALSGGFSANAGCLTALVRATEPQHAAGVELRPRGHGLVERVDVATAKPRTKLDVRMSAVNGSLRVEGSIPKDVPSWEGRIAAPDPVALFGGALESALREGGVQVANGVRRERTQPRVGARVLAKLRTSILDVLEPMNTHSNNACADQLFLAMGNAVEGRGTREGGRAATARALSRLSISTAGLVQVDGSGLSRDDRVSARQMTALIDAVMKLDAKTVKAFEASLAVGGETGTLDTRLKELEGRVHAKTGFINGTSALSGLLDARDGRRLVFSILVEYPTTVGLNTNCWKPMEDAICAELAGQSGG